MLLSILVHGASEQENLTFDKELIAICVEELGAKGSIIGKGFVSLLNTVAMQRASSNSDEYTILRCQASRNRDGKDRETDTARSYHISQIPSILIVSKLTFVPYYGYDRERLISWQASRPHS